MTQPTTKDLTIKRVDRVMEEAVWLDDIHIGRLLYDWKTENITAWPDAGRPRVFFPANKDQAQQHLINQYLKNKEIWP